MYGVVSLDTILLALDHQEELLYVYFLRRKLGHLEDVTLAVGLQIWFQHHGALEHSARIVQDWLHRHYTRKWIGIDDFRAPRSPLPSAIC